MKSILRLSLFALLAAISMPRFVVAQDYFRELSTPRQLSQVAPPQPDEEERSNFALGPARFNVTAGIGLEWNDNITLSDHDTKSDFILRPSLNLDSLWRLSELNTLRFSIGLSYAKYLENSEFDSKSVLLSPNTAISLTAFVGPVAITVRDRFTYQEDPFDLPVLSGVAVYRRAENIAMLQADWPVNEYIKLTAGYNHYNLWTFDKEFESLDRSVDTLYVRPAFVVSPWLTAGINASVNFIDFKENLQNDGRSYLIGPFAELTLTESTHVYLEAGAQKTDFDTNGSIADDEDSNSWYAKGDIINQLTEGFNHRLSASKTSEVGFGSNFYDLYHIEYSAAWKMTAQLSLTPTTFYEYYTTSGDGDTEEASRFGAAVGLRYALSPALTLGADYRFLIKDSNLPDANYRQNLVLLSLYYNF